MTPSTLRAALGAAALALVLATPSCQSQGTAQLTWTGGEGRDTELESPSVSLKSDLVLASARQERREGRLYVQIDLENHRYGNLAFEWRLDWLDDKGFQLDTARTWTPEVIGGRGRKTITAIAPTPAATTWRLAARRPNTVH